MKFVPSFAHRASRRRFPAVFGAFLLVSAVWLLPCTPVAAQSPAYVTNKALVSTGVPAVPPTAPGTRSAQSPIIDQILTTINLGALPPIQLSSKHGIFDLIGVNPDQLVQVTVQYSAAQTGRPIVGEALDGGQIIGQTTMIVGLDHAIHFQFRAAHSPGFNHIALRDGSREIGLQFWVRDQNHPDRNPPVANP